jgi:hypothetical protein
MHPNPKQVMLTCVWTSYTAKAASLISFIDTASLQNLSVSLKTDECCKELEALVVEWKMESLLTETSVTLPTRCLVADHIMNIHAIIVGLKRLANRVDKVNTVDAITLRAARKVVCLLLEFGQEGKDSGTRHEDNPLTCFVQ